MPLQPADVQQAMVRLAGVAHHTPVFQSRWLNEQLGAELFFKAENFQRVGAFKFRGAYNAISQLSPPQKAAGVITHSSGNHAQGVALAAQLLGVKAVVVMPPNAPAVKKAATVGYGATIVLAPAEQREEVSGRLAAEQGYTLIHPYDDDQVIAGQGTAAWELFDEVGQLDFLVVPTGGGGLLSGTALAAAGQCPSCQVVGVEPTTGDDAGQSWRQNKIVALPAVPQTIADGVRTRFIGERNLAVMRQYVAEMLTATDEELLEALHLIWSRLKLVVEPTSALPLAALLNGRLPVTGRRVGIILSGGNVDLKLNLAS